MSSFFGKIFAFLNRDVTGRDVRLTRVHPRLGDTLYLGLRDKGGQWELESRDPATGRAFGVLVMGDEAGIPPAIAGYIADLPPRLDDIFTRCEPSMRKTYPRWTDKPFPVAWRDGFELDTVMFESQARHPLDLEVTYFVPATGHWFTVELSDGVAGEATVDG